MGVSKEKQIQRQVSRRKRFNGGAKAEWREVPHGALIRAVSAAGAAGGAIRLGYTRDGGAFAVGIYGDGEPYTEYLRPGDDIEGFFLEVESLFLDMTAKEETQGRLPGT